MCGLVGIISSYNNGFSYKEAAMFKDMLYMDALRGMDATGIMYADKWNNIQVHKAAIPSPEFIGTPEWRSSERELIQTGIWAFGHNRAATRGEKTDKNSHPFVVDDKIILMQNGTYRGSHKHHKNTDVDTEACAHVIAESASVSEALKKIDAAYAFIWYNVAEKTINIIRNDERPLYVGYLEDGGCAYASEKGILMAAADRNSLNFKYEPYLLKESGLIKIDFSTNVEGEETFEVLDTTYVPTTFSKESDQDTAYSEWWENWHEKRGHQSGGASYARHRGPVHERKTVREGANEVVKKHLDVKTQDALHLLREEIKDKTFTCEALEYTKVFDKDKLSTEYYVYGAVLTEGSTNAMLVVWTVDAVHGEREVINYITNNFFSCKVDYVVQWVADACGTYHYVIVMNEVHPIPMLTSTEKDNETQAAH